MSAVAVDDNNQLVSPAALRLRVTALTRDRVRHQDDLAVTHRKLQAAREYLLLAPKVESALQSLSERLFDQLLGVLEEKLSIALQEVLEQPIKLKADPSFKRGAASVEFYIERDGQHEHIMRGQGGSVANVLSVGLRMFALTTLDVKKHRPFLVLDEQDCWLRPELVPKLVKIIHQAGKALGFQVLLISHYDVSAFERYAEQIYYLTPLADGSVTADIRRAEPKELDAGS